jgi:hypothetical protein
MIWVCRIHAPTEKSLLNAADLKGTLTLDSEVAHTGSYIYFRQVLYVEYT